MTGAKKIRINNEDIAVAAKVFTINGFSAHAGQDQLLAWLGGFQTKGMQVFLIHGELSAQEHLAALIREKFGLPVAIPEYLEEIVLKAGAPFQEIKPPVPGCAIRRSFAACDRFKSKAICGKRQNREISILVRIPASRNR